MAKNAAGGHRAGKKNRKHNRNKLRSPSAKAYKAEGRAEKNKAKKLARHQRHHPNDKQSNYSVVVDYKVVKRTPEQQAEHLRVQAWKRYLRSA